MNYLAAQFLSMLSRYSRCEKGATVIEYCLVGAGISMAIVVAVILIADDFESILDALGGALNSTGSEVEDPA